MSTTITTPPQQSTQRTADVSADDTQPAPSPAGRLERSTGNGGSRPRRGFWALLRGSRYHVRSL